MEARQAAADRTNKARGDDLYVLLALAQQDVPPYLHARSKHVFTVHHLVILLVLEQYENVSCRRPVEWLATATAVTDAMGITRLPRHTTLQKAADRIDVSAVHGMITVCRAWREDQDRHSGDRCQRVPAKPPGIHIIQGAACSARSPRRPCIDAATQLVCAALVQNHPVPHDIKHVTAPVSRVH